MSKLIVIRGNSGSGKSSVAKELRNRAKRPNRVALVEQDYLRRIVLKEKENEGTNNIDLIEQTVRFALERDYDVILEGILYAKRYKEMILRLMNLASESRIYYIDVSLEETLKRHETKPDSKDFGEKQMRAWYNDKNYLDVPEEQTIPESNSFAKTVELILKQTKI